MKFPEIFVVDIPRCIIILIWTGGSVQHDKEIQMITKQQAMAVASEARKSNDRLGEFEGAGMSANAPTALFFYANGVISVAMTDGKFSVTVY